MLLLLQRPSRSSASRSKSNSTLSKQLEQMGDVGANPRRQSTANTHGGMAAAAGAYLADPAELFAAAAAEGAALAAAAAGGGGESGDSLALAAACASASLPTSS